MYLTDLLQDGQLGCSQKGSLSIELSLERKNHEIIISRLGTVAYGCICTLGKSFEENFERRHKRAPELEDLIKKLPDTKRPRFAHYEDLPAKTLLGPRRRHGFWRIPANNQKTGLTECIALMMELNEPRWEIAAIIIDGSHTGDILVCGEMTQSEAASLGQWTFPSTLQRLGNPTRSWSVQSRKNLPIISEPLSVEKKGTKVPKMTDIQYAIAPKGLCRMYGASVSSWAPTSTPMGTIGPKIHNRKLEPQVRGRWPFETDI